MDLIVDHLVTSFKQNTPKMECAAREARGWLLLPPGPAARFARPSPIFVYYFFEYYGVTLLYSYKVPSKLLTTK